MIIPHTVHTLLVDVLVEVRMFRKFRSCQREYLADSTAHGYIQKMGQLPG